MADSELSAEVVGLAEYKAAKYRRLILLLLAHVPDDALDALDRRLRRASDGPATTSTTEPSDGQ